jgi:hypothetical protein
MMLIFLFFLLDIRAWRMRAFLYLVAIFIATIVVLTDFASETYRVVFFAVGVGLLLLKFTFYDQWRLPKNGRDYEMILLGIVYTLISAAIMVYDLFPPYWVGHSLWHAFAFTGMSSAIYGILVRL